MFDKHFLVTFFILELKTKISMDAISVPLKKDKWGYPDTFFLFLHENICLRYTFDAPLRGVSNKYHIKCCVGIRNTF